MIPAWRTGARDHRDWLNVMSDPTVTKATGFVLPVGNGAVGKTSMARALQEETLPLDWADKMKAIRKTTNIEFEFVSDSFMHEGRKYKVLQQILILPGQRSDEIGMTDRTFQKVYNIFKFHIKRIDVLILSYNITEWESFLNLETWLNITSRLTNPSTSFILVGTHLDRESWREVPHEDRHTASANLPGLIKSYNPGWQGTFSSLEVSVLNGKNLDALRRKVSIALLEAIELKTASQRS